MPPNDVPAVHQVDQALAAKPKGIETILSRYLNARLDEPRYKREKNVVTSLAEYGLENVTMHFALRIRYRGQGRWTWKMQI